MRDVIHRQMLLKRPSSSTALYISWALGRRGSRIDSALSRTINISLEDRKGCRGVRFSGFFMVEPMASESRRRK